MSRSPEPREGDVAISGSGENRTAGHGNNHPTMEHGEQRNPSTQPKAAGFVFRHSVGSLLWRRNLQQRVSLRRGAPPPPEIASVAVALGDPLVTCGDLAMTGGEGLTMTRERRCACFG